MEESRWFAEEWPRSMKAILSLLLLVLPLAAQAATDLGRPTGETPYDDFMQPVQAVLQQTGGQASPGRARELMKVAYGFRYEHKTPYLPQAPAVTEQRRAGDCKDKALWLCAQLRDSSVRFVIGKTRGNARLNHAWLTWQSEGTTWILDPTNKPEPLAAEAIGTGEYIALYSFSRRGKFAHGANSGAPVAQKGRNGKQTR